MFVFWAKKKMLEFRIVVLGALKIAEIMHPKMLDFVGAYKMLKFPGVFGVWGA